MVTLREHNFTMTQRVKPLELKIECPADGSMLSDVAVIGEYPRERELFLQKPLTGEVGSRFWSSLKKLVPELSRTSVYITHGVKRKVTIARHKKIPDISSDEVEKWSVLLEWELNQLPNLRYIILLGDYALQTCTNERKIVKWRGSVLDKCLQNGNKIKVLVVDNPMTGYEIPKEEVIFKFFIAKFKRIYNGTYSDYNIITHINPNVRQAIEYLEFTKHEAINKKLPISYDIETMAQQTSCIGLTTNTHEGMCINFRGRNANIYDLKDELKIRLKFQELFSDTRLKFVAQNGSFDASWLWFKDRIQVHKNWFDTMLAHHLLYNTLPHNLGFLTVQYTNHPYYKDEGNIYKEGGDMNSQWRYNIKDCCITLKIQQKLHKELLENDLDSFFFNHIMKIQPKLIESCINGILIDIDMKQMLIAETGVEVEKLKEEFVTQCRVITNDSELEINPNSNQQLRELFFSKLKLVGYGTSTDAKNRKRIKAHPHTPEAARKMLRILDKYQVENKFLTTYASTLLDDDDCFRSEYSQIGVSKAPGRLSSKKPVWETGGNSQNLPDRANPMFIAPKGYCFVYFDLAQAEARVVGYLANIESWIADFERARLDNSFDCHRSLASEMFKIPYDKVPIKDKDENDVPTIRFTAKRCKHGLNYRMEAATLAETTDMTLFEAQNNYIMYHETTPELRIWWNDLEKEIKQNRMMFNCFGRRWTLLQKLDKTALESMVAFKPQSTIGDLVQKIWYLSEDDLLWPSSARIIRNVHDALYALCKIEDKKLVGAIMKNHAEKPFTVNKRELIIPADLKHSIAGEDGIHRFSTLEEFIL